MIENYVGALLSKLFLTSRKNIMTRNFDNRLTRKFV